MKDLFLMALTKKAQPKIMYKMVGFILIYKGLPLIRATLADTKSTPEDTKEETDIFLFIK